jgi:hypothetical protein
MTVFITKRNSKQELSRYVVFLAASETSPALERFCLGADYLHH